jgi:hypothetical protein
MNFRVGTTRAYGYLLKVLRMQFKKIITRRFNEIATGRKGAYFMGTSCIIVLHALLCTTMYSLTTVL